MNTPEPRIDLLKMSDKKLRLLAGRVTHQHFKGGLYELLGPAFDTATGKETDFGYIHHYPHRTKLYLRDQDEFNEKIETPEWHPMYGGAKEIKRFRKLGESW